MYKRIFDIGRKCMILCVLFCSCCEMNKQDAAQVLQPDTNMVSNEKDSVCIADELYHFILSRKPLLTNWDSSVSKHGVMLTFDTLSSGDTVFEITSTYQREELHDFKGVASYDDFSIIILDKNNLGLKYYNANLLSHPQNLKENNQRMGIVTCGIVRNGHLFEDNRDLE